ncbi:alpha/beta fold hydrolase [Pigmentiphaga litoralis]|uniref:3-oxoadipate enol-lactonase n=1 Tax=Pigmentiphaga litoralis TaxID=516702 RepID=A0A7Y9ISN1_9BURK|nr:alpha/beta hydrolase [Pigmentiphaga litoralis]NYE24054.1 3-oxoadipate enol-lactonase [Pigmentiphaga litoralis]NYE82332.1 3-oxoadipate enol-lactonase [Pigmentiphaga litoralis]
MSVSISRRYGPVAPVQTLTVTTTDAQRLTLRVLREATDPTALPVVFVHALAMNGDMWAGVADALAEALASPASASASAASGSDALTRASSSSAPGGVMIAMDCRGHGVSDAPAGTYTTDRFAQDIADVATALGAERLHLVGCSMGGTVALAFAGTYPERLASLTVIDATAWYGADAPKNWEGRAQAALKDGMGSLVEFQRARWFSPEFLAANNDLVEQAVDVFTANRVAAYASTCRMLGVADERAGLERYDGPAAVVVGEHDYATPVTMAEDVAARLPAATLTVIADTRHYTPLEAPQQVAACIAEVMRRAR